MIFLHTSFINFFYKISIQLRVHSDYEQYISIPFFVHDHYRKLSPNDFSTAMCSERLNYLGELVNNSKITARNRILNFQTRASCRFLFTILRRRRTRMAATAVNNGALKTDTAFPKALADTAILYSLTNTRSPLV